MTHPSVGYDKHPSTGELGSPAEVNILTSTGDAGVKAPDRRKEARAHQHTRRRYGENVANSVVLLLVSLGGFDHVGRGGELVDDETDVLQDLGCSHSTSLGPATPALDRSASVTSTLTASEDRATSS